VLPLTLREDLPEGLGTRHRAAVGITEESDAVVVVVSEETSAISVVYAGELVRNLDGPRLREVLREILSGGRLERLTASDELRPPATGAAAPAASRRGGA
jgi:diadenylate cyclase